MPISDEARVQTGPSISAGVVPPTVGGAPTAPEVLLGQGKPWEHTLIWKKYTNHVFLVQDPALKNLMMAWYYAGYYTGLYEGRQQGPKIDGAGHQKWNWFEACIHKDFCFMT